jgi:hypothetical protein
MLSLCACGLGQHHQKGRQGWQRFAPWLLWWYVVWGPSVIMGAAWSRTNRNFGLQAWVIPACCTGDLTVTNSA